MGALYESHGSEEHGAQERVDQHCMLHGMIYSGYPLQRLP